MDRKLYVVTFGYYDELCGIFSTKEKALEYTNQRKSRDLTAPYRINEWKLDKGSEL